MILNAKEKKRIVDNLTWMITDMQYKHNENKLNQEEGSQGGYSSHLQAAMELLEDIKKTETIESTGCHRKSVGINCREFIIVRDFDLGTKKGCEHNRQGICALSKITLESMKSPIVGMLKCVQAKEIKKEEEEK